MVRAWPAAGATPPDFRAGAPVSPKPPIISSEVSGSGRTLPPPPVASSTKANPVIGHCSSATMPLLKYAPTHWGDWQI
ncbi:hypothetical protein KX816_14940 [Sphingosinicellaceae bacterium]|nr:hypothetical protein KX816_14940 [Sphingosinicellaceae bacterium]